MKTKKSVRKNRIWYQEPKKPEEGSTKYRFEILGYVSDRAQYFPNEESDYEDDEDGLSEDTGNPPERQSISLKEINDLIEKESLNSENIFLTASFSDDYLVLEVVNRIKINYDALLKEYNKEYAEWKKQQKGLHKQEEQDIKWKMEDLKRRQEELEKKRS